MKLRLYQKKAVEAGVNFMKSDEQTGAIIVIPTGGGKSLVIASIAKELEGNILVLQPSKEILEQNVAKAKLFGIENIAIFSASMNEKNIDKLTFATIGSIINKKELFSHFDYLIIDELHYVNAKGGMYEKFIKYFGNKVLGLTASPYRIHNYTDMFTDMRSVVAKFVHRTRPRIFTKIIHITQLQELYKDGFLCPIKYRTNQNYDVKKIKLNSTGMDYDKKSLLAYHEKQNIVGIATELVRKGKARHILVFTTTVEEARLISKNLSNIGVWSATVSAKTKKKDREDILLKFKQGKIKVVCNVGTLTTGFDFPELDCIIMARPTQSVSLFFQMLGRGIRPAKNKPYCEVIDLCGNISKFGYIETFEIKEDKPGMHRLYSNVGPLTGFDFISYTDLELTGYKGKKESKWQKQVGGVVPFGKHKGLHITKVPTGYLQWAVEAIQGSTGELFKKELIRRYNNKKQNEKAPF